MDRFLLAESDDEFNMVSAWKDQVFCTILKNGTMSLRARKASPSEGVQWFGSRRGIKTPRQFIDAIQDIDEIDLDWLHPESFLPVLYKHAPVFAALTHKYIELSDNEDETGLKFLCQSQRHMLLSEIPLKDDFDFAVRFVEIVFNFLKKEYSVSGKLPTGQHKLMDSLILFP